jgi:tetratricopeptide (TPR) repeat protein
LAAVSSRIPKRSRGPLGRPFPVSVSLLVIVGSVVLLALVFAVRVLLLGGDWADGAVAIGTVALALAAVFGLIALLRATLGRRSLTFALLTIVLVAGLAMSGIVGLVGSAPLHLAQAQAMEKSGQWGVAINEFGLSGEKGPDAPDVARVQNAWGQQLLQRGDYQGALGHFQTVLDDYQESGNAVQSAQMGQFQAYAAWMKSDASNVPYRDAITAFANFGSSPDCNSDCKTTLADVAPEAYYLYGVQLLQQKRYQLALTEFSKLETQYGSSTYASQGHAKAATAYLAYGQEQISGQECAGAVSSFKTLVTNYKDTPEAKTAQNALSAPQDVSGFIANPPANPAPTVHLSKHMSWSTLYFSNEYSTAVDLKTGAFTFKLVAQGTYYLSMTHPISGGIDYFAWPIDDTKTTFYSFTVTPLCPVQLGTFH